MKATNYKVKIDDNENASVEIYYNADKIDEIDLGNVKGKNSVFVEQLAKQFMEKRNIELVNYVATPDEEFMADDKIDIKLCQTEVRKVLRALGGNSLTLSEKKDRLGIYNTTLQGAAMMAKLIALNLAIDKAKPKTIDRV